MKEFVTQKLSCPACKNKLNRMTSLEGDDAPEPGVITVCVFCAVVLEVGEGFVLKVMPDLSVLDEPTRKTVLSIRALIKPESNYA